MPQLNNTIQQASNEWEAKALEYKHKGLTLDMLRKNGNFTEFHYDLLKYFMRNWNVDAPRVLGKIKAINIADLKETYNSYGRALDFVINEIEVELAEENEKATIASASRPKAAFFSEATTLNSSEDQTSVQTSSLSLSPSET